VSLLLILVHVVVCFVLILVILLQAGRGQGLTGASFGGGNVQSLLGTKASSFLTKATSVSAVVFLFTCIGLNVMEVHKSRSLFQPKNAQAPLDVEKIRKALDKVKQSEAAAIPQKSTEPAPATAVTTNAATATSDAVKAADFSEQHRAPSRDRRTPAGPEIRLLFSNGSARRFSPSA